MKKISKLLMGALAVLALASCQDEKGFVEPAVNPQLPGMTNEDLVVTSLIPEAIDLSGLEQEPQVGPVSIGQISTLNNLPEGYVLKFVGTMGREESFEHAADFNIENTESQLTAAAADLEAAYVEAIGKSPKAKKVYFRVAAYAVNGTSEVRIGGPDYYVVEGSSVVTPLDLKIVIEDGYGLLGTINGWSVANALPMGNGGVSGYDNPVFTIDVTITAAEAEGGWWWKVVSQSCIDAGDWLSEENTQFGPFVNGDASLEGALDGKNAQAGCIKVPGVYTFSVDMENRTYVFTPKYDILYTPGEPNGWSQVNSAWLIAPIGGKEFCGLMPLFGEFKITSATDWSGTNYGAGEKEGELSTSGGNLKGPKDATLCFVKANTEKLTYSIVPITRVGMIGSFAASNWGSDVAFEKVDDTLWMGEVTLSEGDEFKIRFNNSWDINLGGSVDCLEFNGPNMFATKSGKFEVYLDLSKIPYTLTIE